MSDIALIVSWSDEYNRMRIPIGLLSQATFFPRILRKGGHLKSVEKIRKIHTTCNCTVTTNFLF